MPQEHNLSEHDAATALVLGLLYVDDFSREYESGLALISLGALRENETLSVAQINDETLSGESNIAFAVRLDKLHRRELVIREDSPDINDLPEYKLAPIGRLYHDVLLSAQTDSHIKRLKEWRDSSIQQQDLLNQMRHTNKGLAKVNSDLIRLLYRHRKWTFVHTAITAALVLALAAPHF